MLGRILIVEDEDKLREIIKLFFIAEGFEVDTCSDGESAIISFQQKKADLVILDVMLPGISGFEVCQKIRELSDDVPILFLTALGDDDYHTLGYRVGADDYITKPFKVSILALKAKRILRCTSVLNQEGEISAGIILLDVNARTCNVDKEEVLLTQKEFDLLQELINNQDRVLTREYLLQKIWGFDFYGEMRVVDTIVKNLRKKLGPAAQYIQTVISVGYKFRIIP